MRYDSQEQHLSILKDEFIKNLKDNIQNRIDNLNVIINTSYNNRLSAIEFLNSIKYSDGYLFVLDKNKTTLVHKNKMITNIPFNMLTDEKLKNNVSNIVDIALKDGYGFMEYNQSQNLFKDFEQSKKISYVKYVPQYEFIIGTGLYTNDIEKKLRNKELILDLQLQNDINRLLIIGFIITFIGSIVLLVINKKIIDNLD